MERKYNIIISGGGTGGHVFPAISIANALKNALPAVDILFVGALGKIEMEKVPKAGYKIIGLPVVGFKRQLALSNLLVIFKLLASLFKARKIIKSFNPDIAIGVGGYASGPVLRVASNKGVPVIIQEQNSYPGVTNKLLAKKALKICVAYEGMEKFFPAEKIVLTGNPIRQDLTSNLKPSDKAFQYFNIPEDKKVILAIGGSLGARTINRSLLESIDVINESRYHLLWQTGKNYFSDLKDALKDKRLDNVTITEFIDRMDYAYSIADVIISRAGAGTISELCVVGKPVILIPSPNVTEDHQTKNAMALVSKNAALMIKDNEASEIMVSQTISLLNDEELKSKLKDNIRKLAISDSSERVVKIIVECLNDYHIKNNKKGDEV